MKRTLLSCLLATALLPANTYSQDKIDKSKKALTESEGVKNTNSGSSSSRSSSGSDDGESFGESIVAEVVVFVFQYTLGAAWFGIFGSYEDEDHLSNDLTKYPYNDTEAGNYYNPEFGEGSIYEFRVDVKDKFLYSSNYLFANHLETKVRPFQYFYLKADYYQLYEYQRVTNTSDNLSLFYFNFAYDRLRFNRFNLGWTVGASYVANGINKAGFSYGLNTEFFLKKHISFMAGAKWSRINSQPVNAYEFESRWHKKNFYLTAGFEHLKIAQPNYNFITIGGGIYF
jgi:hypothetical protein